MLLYFVFCENILY